MAWYVVLLSCLSPSLTFNVLIQLSTCEANMSPYLRVVVFECQVHTFLSHVLYLKVPSNLNAMCNVRNPHHHDSICLLFNLFLVRRFSTSLSETRSCISACLNIYSSSKHATASSLTLSHSRSILKLRNSLSSLAHLSSELFVSSSDSSSTDSTSTDSSTSSSSLPFGESLHELSHSLHRWTLRLSAGTADSSSGGADSSSSRRMNSSLENAINSMLVAFQNAVKSVDGKDKEVSSVLCPPTPSIYGDGGGCTKKPI